MRTAPLRDADFEQEKEISLGGAWICICSPLLMTPKAARWETSCSLVLWSCSHHRLGFGKPWGLPFAALRRANPMAHPSSLCLWHWRWDLEGTWFGILGKGGKHGAVWAAVVCAPGLPPAGSGASGVPGHWSPPCPSTAWYSWQHWGYFGDPVLPASPVAAWELRRVVTMAVRPLDSAEPWVSSKQWTPLPGPCFWTVNTFVFSFTKSSLGHWLRGRCCFRCSYLRWLYFPTY